MKGIDKENLIKNEKRRFFESFQTVKRKFDYIIPAELLKSKVLTGQIVDKHIEIENQEQKVFIFKLILNYSKTFLLNT